MHAQAVAYKRSVVCVAAGLLLGVNYYIIRPLALL